MLYLMNEYILFFLLNSENNGPNTLCCTNVLQNVSTMLSKNGYKYCNLFVDNFYIKLIKPRYSIYLLTFY